MNSLRPTQNNPVHTAYLINIATALLANDEWANTHLREAGEAIYRLVEYLTAMHKAGYEVKLEKIGG